MRRPHLALPLLTALLAACDNDDGTEPTPTIAASISGAVTISQGQSGTATVTVTRGGGYSGPVGFAITGLPTGVTGTFDPVTAPAATGDVTSTLTLTATAGATTGAANYTVTASGTGVTSATATGSLTVNATPNFTLTVDPTTLNVAQGGTGTVDVTITRTGGFTGAVNLSVANLPTGVTAEFDDPAPTGDAAVLTLTVAGTAAVAQTNLSIDGTGTPGTRSAALTLNVTAAGGSNSSWKFCDLDNLPVHFAYQDGTGPWTAVTGTVAGDGTTYTFNIAAATGGVAFVQGSAGTDFTTFVFHGSQAELQTFSANQCATNPNATRTLNGSVAGVGATDQTFVIMGPASGSVAGAATFQLQNALNGPADLIATQVTVAVGPPYVVTPVKLIIRRGLDIANGGTIPVLDFGAAEAFNPVTAQITINNLGTDNALAQVSYQTTTSRGPLYAGASESSSVHTVYGVPAAQQAASDLHSIDVQASGRAVRHWTKNLADMTVTLGDPLTAPTITSLGNTPYPRYQATGPIQAAYDDVLGFWLMAQDVGGGVIITATRGYFAGANYTLVAPDLSGTTGWQNTWALAVGQPITTIMTAAGFSSNGTLPPNIDGGVMQFATQVSEVTP